MGGKATSNVINSENSIGKVSGGGGNPAAIKFKKQFSRVSTGASTSVKE